MNIEIDCLPEHVRRMVTERDELRDRTRRLCSFMETSIFDALPEEEQNDMGMQRHHMQRYLLVLNRRITRAGA